MSVLLHCLEFSLLIFSKHGPLLFFSVYSFVVLVVAVVVVVIYFHFLS